MDGIPPFRKLLATLLSFVNWTDKRRCMDVVNVLVTVLANNEPVNFSSCLFRPRRRQSSLWPDDSVLEIFMSRWTGNEIDPDF